MAAAQIPVNVNTEWGRQLRRFRNLLLETIELGREVRGKMIRATDGGDYSQVEEQFGLPAGTGSTCFGELDSMFSKLETDAAVTNVQAAMKQFIDIVG